MTNDLSNRSAARPSLLPGGGLGLPSSLPGEPWKGTMSGGDALDWSGLVYRSVHTTRLWIIEAMLWIDRPLSASELERVFGDTMSISAIAYHMTILAKFGIVDGLEKERVRGAWKTRYVFASAVMK